MSHNKQSGLLLMSIRVEQACRLAGSWSNKHNMISYLYKCVCPMKCMRSDSKLRKSNRNLTTLAASRRFKCIEWALCLTLSLLWTLPTGFAWTMLQWQRFQLCEFTISIVFWIRCPPSVCKSHPLPTAPRANLNMKCNASSGSKSKIIWRATSFVWGINDSVHGGQDLDSATGNGGSGSLFSMGWWYAWSH